MGIVANRFHGETCLIELSMKYLHRYFFFIYGGVAQSVEQTAHIRSVRGSNPFATTIAV
jgi:hypothetical protein